MKPIIIALIIVVAVHSAYADESNSTWTDPYSISPGAYVHIVPPPPGWDVNQAYIPSWDRLWEIQYKRWLLEQKQQPTPGQSFRQTIPKSRRFRK